MRLIRISAWNDSGGAFAHRLFDGHPDLRCWPFEMLLGQDHKRVDAFGEDWFKGRFRWPRLGADLSNSDPEALFDRISDSEVKTALSSTNDGKRAFVLPVTLDAWRAETKRRWMAGESRSQASFLRAYIDSLFHLMDGGSDSLPTLAHCPCAILDAPETWADFPETSFICVIRSPLSGFADMSRRHPSLEPARYAAKWSLINGASLLSAGKRPDRVRLITLEQLLREREQTMRALCEWVGVSFAPSVLKPTWRGRPISELAMDPFGGVPSLSVEREAQIAAALPAEVRTTLVQGTAAVANLIFDLLQIPILPS
jgi:hypothetical protein